MKLEETPSPAKMLKSVQELLINNANTINILENSQQDLELSRDQSLQCLQDHHLTMISKLKQAYEDNLAEINTEYGKLKENNERKEKTLSRCSLALMPELQTLKSGRSDDSIQRSKEILERMRELVKLAQNEKKVTFNFIPKIGKLKLGFLQLCCALPEDFTLHLLTPIHDISPGKQVLCGIEGQFTAENLQHLQFGIRRKNKIIISKKVGVEGRIFSFIFSADTSDVYTVMACLYGHPIARSPLTLTINSMDAQADFISCQGNGFQNVPTSKPSQEMTECDSTMSTPVKPQAPGNGNTDLNTKYDAPDTGVNLQKIDKQLNKGDKKSVQGKKKIDEMGGEAQWKNGEVCIARWEEDGIWYNGQIETPNSDGSFMVKFVDYGNSAAVMMPNIVKSAPEIPVIVPDYDVDENVGSRCKNPAQNQNIKEIQVEVNIDVKEPGPLFEDTNLTGKMPVFHVDDVCVAKWSEDQVWYNAIVQSVNADSSYTILFNDYGNTDTVDRSFVVKNVSEIPVDDQIDENIKMPLVFSDKDNAEKLVEQETEKATNNVKETKILEQEQDKHLAGKLPVKTIFQINEICVAKWSEDQVWYNAIIQSMNADRSYVVQFTDYGNTDTVDKSFVVSDASKIPKENDECVDENVAVICVQTDKTDAEEDTLKQETKLETSTNNVEKSLVASSASEIPVNDQIDENIKGAFEHETKFKKGTSIADQSKLEDTVATSKDSEVPRQRTISASGKRMITDAMNKVIRQRFVEEKSQRRMEGPSFASESDDEELTKSHPSLENEKSLPINSIKETNGSITRVNYDGDKIETEKKKKRDKSKPPMPRRLKTPNSHVDKKELSENAPTNSLSPCQYSLPTSTSNTPVEKSEAKFTYPPDQIGKNVGIASKPLKPINILKEVSTIPNGTPQVVAKSVLNLSKDITSPIGITVLLNKNFVISNSGDDSVIMFKPDGKPLAKIKSLRPFKRPTDMATLSTGELVVRDDVGLQLFSQSGEFIKVLGGNEIDQCFGVSEDEEGRILTINCNKHKGKGGITDPGETDIFFICPKSGAVVKRIELTDIIDNKFHSKCRFLNYRHHTIYIVDLGLDQIYKLMVRDEPQASIIGRTGSGPGQLKDPAGLVVDLYGNFIVADSLNHRLQIFNNIGNYVGLVKVDVPVNRPSGIYLDQDLWDLYILNMWGNSMTKYRIGN